jgi:hypothetical protein
MTKKKQQLNNTKITKPASNQKSTLQSSLLPKIWLAFLPMSGHSAWWN